MNDKRCFVCNCPADEAEMVYSATVDDVPAVLLDYLCADMDCYGDAHRLVTVLYLTVIGDTETPTVLANHRAALTA